MKVEQVINCGGIAEKNPFVMQIYADVCNRPMKISRSAQTCALGAAIFGAVAAAPMPTSQAAQAKMTGVKQTGVPAQRRQRGRVRRALSALSRTARRLRHAGLNAARCQRDERPDRDPQRSAAKASLTPSMLDDLKQQVCQANLDLVAHGLVTLTWGNVSGCRDDRRHLVIKPSGVPYDEMRPEHMVVVDLETGKVVDGKLKPSSDTPTHRVLYQQFRRHRRHHAHAQPERDGVRPGPREIPCFGTTHADHFFGPVPVTRPLTKQEVDEAYELNTGRVIVERFRRLDPLAMPGVLVASHAPFAWGKRRRRSVKNAVALEAVADMALDTLALEPDAPPLEQYVLDKHYHRKHGKDAYYGQK